MFPGSIVIEHWLEMGKNTLQTSVHFIDHIDHPPKKYTSPPPPNRPPLKKMKIF